METSGTTSITQLPGNIIPALNDQPPQNQSNTNNIVLTNNQVISETTKQIQNPNPNPNSNPNPNINLNINPNTNINSMPTNNSNNQENNYNEMINQLQKANIVGATTLPSRDIPINPTGVNNDIEIKPNFIPEPQNSNYITNSYTPESLVSQNTKKENYLNKLDSFQLPLLASVLYFLFQLPVFRKIIKKSFPALFGNDSNPNLYGYIFYSLLYACVFYLFVKIINQLTLNI